MTETTQPAPRKRRKVNYINNRTLHEAMVAYKTALKEARENQIIEPVIPKYIGESILLICNNLAKKPNFSGYTYKQDMISDGIFDCVAAVDNFDPNKTNNPFGYFTQIAKNAFIRRIQKEKKQTYTKHKNFENSFIMNGLWSESENIHLKANEYSSEIVRSFEEKNNLPKPKKGVKIIGLEEFQEKIDEE